MAPHPKHLTRQIETEDRSTLLAVKINGESNKVVVLEEAAMGYAATLDPKAAHNLGQALIYAARIAALNLVMGDTNVA